MFAKEVSALVCPGQGAQFVGMSAEFMENSVTKHLFEQADDILGFKLSSMMKDGSAEELTLTENTQPALLLSSYVVWHYLSTQANVKIDDVFSYVAGHSLGEYSALAIAEALSFEDALKLVRLRGQAMQEAVPAGQGAMAAVLGLTYVDVDSIARNVGCWVANDNSEGQAVFSGHERDVDEASNLAVMQDAKKVVRLDVSAPFHCPMMEPAAEKMAEALAQVQVNTPRVPVVCNVTADVETSPENLVKNLVSQVVGTVRWRESMMMLAEKGVTDIVEVGAGKVLSGLAKRCDKRLKATTLNTPESIDAFIETKEKVA